MNQTARVTYRIFRRTDSALVVEGPAGFCAQIMGWTMATFYTMVTRSRSGGTQYRFETDATADTWKTEFARSWDIMFGHHPMHTSAVQDPCPACQRRGICEKQNENLGPDDPEVICDLCRTYLQHCWDVFRSGYQDDVEDTMKFSDSLEFYERLCVAMAAAGCTTKQLAECLGISTTAVYKYQSGEVLPPRERLLAMARCLEELRPGVLAYTRLAEGWKVADQARISRQ